MGDTELSYFLPSRQSGVNDMYLHLGFRAPERLVQRSRVRIVWAILRLRHPLMGAKVEMNNYDDVRFMYEAPFSADDSLVDADANLEYTSETKDELIDRYLNGGRTLSNDRLSYLIVSQPADDTLPTPPRTPSPSRDAYQQNFELTVVNPDERQLELLICAMHFLGDGMALHQFANDFFGLLGSGQSDAELQEVLEREWEQRWNSDNHGLAERGILPPCLEDRFPSTAKTSTHFRDAAAEVDFQLAQASLVGGQTFPRRKDPMRHTVVPTISFPEARTKAMLKKCKERGVSISAALFAVCNLAWARVGGGRAELPAMMYSALNMRPYLAKAEADAIWDSYWFLAIGYFNVILPNFAPAGGDEKTFWHRARQAKLQSARAARSKLIVSRARRLARERGEHARVWAKEDDEKEKGTWVPPSPPPSASPDASSAPSIKNLLPRRDPVPSSALIGLSLLGNLDGIYAHSSFPDIKLHTLTTGSRQRQGAILLFGYTFQRRLWVSLGYDQNGFADGIIEKLWTAIEGCVEEFLG
ncbi:hypothetical protein IEO21_05067 [Rhodonia placenta]|uniref:Uncharacterized protein n=1 Tax=Rhodonia placenta TaxID=104341 RepID=A0A8H7P2L6_9APHY|nr:hypothetical protein IEO21_05067 [Postia placenta]